MSTISSNTDCVGEGSSDSRRVDEQRAADEKRHQSPGDGDGGGDRRGADVEQDGVGERRDHALALPIARKTKKRPTNTPSAVDQQRRRALQRGQGQQRADQQEAADASARKQSRRDRPRR